MTLRRPSVYTLLFLLRVYHADLSPVSMENRASDTILCPNNKAALELFKTGLGIKNELSEMIPAFSKPRFGNS
jgi:hypothetical protein